jgi:hypothetical protein
MALIIPPTNACGSQTDTIPLISSSFPYVEVAYSTCFRLTTKETTICCPERPCYTNVGHSKRLHVYNLVSLGCKFLRFIYGNGPCPYWYWTKVQICQYWYGHHLMPLPVMYHAGTGTGPKYINADTGTGTV